MLLCGQFASKGEKKFKHRASASPAALTSQRQPDRQNNGGKLRALQAPLDGKGGLVVHEDQADQAAYSHPQ